MRISYFCALSFLMMTGCHPGENSARDVPEASIEGTNAASSDSAIQPATPAVALNILTVSGLGALKIGKAVPRNSGFVKYGAQPSETCLVYQNSAIPGVYAIVEEGVVRRITAGRQSSTVSLASGLGVGWSEQRVRAEYPSFLEEPHAYLAAPATYLTSLGVSDGSSALRFEIDQSEKVRTISVGVMPWLSYADGCPT